MGGKGKAVLEQLRHQRPQRRPHQQHGQRDQHRAAVVHPGRTGVQPRPLIKPQQTQPQQSQQRHPGCRDFGPALLMRLQGQLRGQGLNTAAPAQMAIAQLKDGPARQWRGIARSQAALAHPTAVAAGQQTQTGTRSRTAFAFVVVVCCRPLQLRMFGGQVNVIQHYFAPHRATDAGRPLADPLCGLDPPVAAQHFDYRAAFHAKPSR